MSFNHRKFSMLAGTATAALMVAGSAMAQAPAAGAAQTSEVVVTASRVVRNGFQAPTPVTVIGVEQLQARAAVNVADIINESPAFRTTATQAGNGIGGGFGRNNLDLRGLGTTRTLVLVNGRRHVGSALTGEVDLNMIPTSLIERTEVVTGGASAEWGSDAVAGVVNLILKNKLQGFQGNLSYGTTDKGDGNAYNASLAYGTSFAGGKGHVLIGGEYDMNNGLPIYQKARDWSKKLYGTLSLNANPALRPAGFPVNIIAPGFQYATTTRGGIIIPKAGAGGACGTLCLLTFLPGGGTTKFNQGLAAGTTELGGDNPNFNFNTGFNVVNPLERGSAFFRTEYQVLPKVNAWLELGAGKSQQHVHSAGHLGDGQGDAFVIKNDNAFLPAAIKTQMAAQGLTSFTISRFDSEIGDDGRYKVLNERDTRRAAFGLDGELGGGWSWDAYYQYGYSRSHQILYDKVTTPNYLSATDAIVGPTGSIVCRAVLAGADPGCVPFNVFGVGAPSAAALDYVTHDTFLYTYNREQVAAANIRGEPFSVWAGPVSFAAGVEWRKESAKQKSDPYSNAKEYDFGNEQPVPSVPVNYNFQGKVFSIPASPYNVSVPGGASYNVKEVYAETVVPLAKDTGFIHTLDLNGAVRRTDYSVSGAVTTWKFGATFEDSSRQLRLRGTRSRDIRAPNLQELFNPGAVAIATVNDSVRGTGSILARVISSGSTALVPEVADTVTYGAVVSPNFIPGFRASVDYYKIDIAGVISTLGGQTIVDRCRDGNADLCKLITRDGTGSITDVQNNFLNINRLKTTGVDFEADYRVPVAKVGVPGTFDIRALATYVPHIITVDAVGPTDRGGQTVSKWVYNVAFNYSLGKFSSNLTARVLSRRILDVTRVGPEDAGYSPTLANSVNRNRDPAVLYLNLSAQYTIVDSGSKKLVLYGVVNNLTDRDPPGTSGGNTTTTPLYDTVGRFFRVGVRFNY